MHDDHVAAELAGDLAFLAVGAHRELAQRLIGAGGIVLGAEHAVDRIDDEAGVGNDAFHVVQIRLILRVAVILRQLAPQLLVHRQQRGRIEIGEPECGDGGQSCHENSCDR